MTINALPSPFTKGDAVTELYNDVIGQLKFDCIERSTNVDLVIGESEVDEKCLNETEPLRRLVEPIAINFVEHVYYMYLSYTTDVNKKGGVTDYLIKSGMCQFLQIYAYQLDFVLNIDETSPELYTVFVSLGKDLGKYPSIYATLQDIQIQLATSEQESANMTFEIDFYSQGCQQFLQKRLTSAGQAVLLTLLHFDLGAKTAINIENIDYISADLQARLKDVLGPAHHDEFATEIEYSEHQHMKFFLDTGLFLDKDIFCFDQHNKSTMLFPMCHHPDLFHEDCCQMEQKIAANYQSIIKFYKYTMESSVAQIQGASHLKEVQSIVSQLEAKGFVLRNGLSEDLLRNIKPEILACNYGPPATAVQANCSLFTKSFTNNGFGYTFNQLPFNDMFHKSNWSSAAYDELVRKVDDGDRKGKDILKPALNGPGHSLSMILKTPMNIKGIFDYLTFGQRILSIGSPYSIPNLSGQGIVLSPGLHYTVMVAPTVVTMHGNLINYTPSERGCMYKTDTHNLTLFSNYTYENCLFECQMKRAIKECGCVPIYFPRFDNTPICPIEVTIGDFTCFSRVLHSSPNPKGCSDCIVDCESVSYSYTVLTKPIDVIQMCPFTSVVLQWLNQKIATKHLYD